MTEVKTVYQCLTQILFLSSCSTVIDSGGFFSTGVGQSFRFLFVLLRWYEDQRIKGASIFVLVGLVWIGSLHVISQEIWSSSRSLLGFILGVPLVAILLPSPLKVCFSSVFPKLKPWSACIKWALASGKILFSPAMDSGELVFRWLLQFLSGRLKSSHSKLSETVDALQPKDDEDCGRVRKTTLKDGVGNEASSLRHLSRNP
ncbi:hypothetical protein Bca4012_092233 [Brassica carinata]